MNWFERYGIVGMFFIFMTGVWLLCLFPDLSSILLTAVKDDRGLVGFIVGFCGIVFLPIGYLIVILGQVLYYRTTLWEKIHCKYWEQLSPDAKNVIINREKQDGRGVLSEDDKKNEWKLEAILTYYARTMSSDLEKDKLLLVFASKRYDVVAINRSIILALFISLISAILIKLFIIHIYMVLMGFLSCYMLMLYTCLPFVIAVIIWLVLHHSNGILEHQIIEAGRRNLEEITKQSSQ